MKQELARALEERNDVVEQTSSDRILAASFFRKRPLQAGTTPTSGERLADVVRLDAHRAARATGASRTET